MIYKKQRQAGILIAAIGGLFLLVFVLLQISGNLGVWNWYLKIIALILIFVGAVLNIYAFQKYTAKRIKMDNKEID
ncbi:MAG TPA: hypothetical protein ENK52_03415 [Saprospiraceae bacterium]|nr:hypothetical protein [Saprospiraceae bacterium]